MSTSTIKTSSTEVWENDNGEVETVPRIREEVETVRDHFHEGLEREQADEHVVHRVVQVPLERGIIVRVAFQAHREHVQEN